MVHFSLTEVDTETPAAVTTPDAQSVLSDVSFRPGLLKLIHQFLLYNYPCEEVMEFWKAILPCTEIEPQDIRYFLNLIYASNNCVSLKLAAIVLNSFESFLVNKGDSSEDLVRNLFIFMMEIGGGNFSKTIHYWLSVFKQYQPHNIDLRREIMHTCHQSSRYACRRFALDLVHESQNNGIVKVVLSFGIKYHNKLYSPHFDCDLWVRGRLKTVPITLGLPEYEKVTIISDVRSVEEIVQDASLATGKVSSPAGAVKVKRYTFHEFVKRTGVAVPHLDFTALQTEVVEVLDDYYCQKKKRIVLHKGCIYGAPVYLFEIVFAESIVKNLMHTVSHTMDTIGHEKAIEIPLKALHDALLLQAERRFAFRYDTLSDTMTLNGNYFNRSIPAKVLRKIIKKYMEQGHDGGIEIERKWLLNDPEIVPDRNNPNLERRFELIAEAFKKKCPDGCSFTRPSKGIIKFIPNGQITFEER